MNNLAISNQMEQDNQIRLNADILKALQNASSMIPPLWGLNDIVAVNPYLGFANKSIEDTHNYLQQTTGSFAIPSISIQKELFEKGYYTKQDILECLEQNNLNSILNVSQLISELENQQQTSIDTELITSYAKFVDQNNKFDSNWVNGITIDIGRFCSLRFDEGVSQFSSYKEQSLFLAWKRYAQTSLAMHARGIKNFHKLVQSLPDNLYEILEIILNDIGSPKTQKYEQYFFALISEIQGWAGYLRSKRWGQASVELDEVKELLIIRLVYDYALSKQIPQFIDKFYQTFQITDFSDSADKSYEIEKLCILQESLEHNYQKNLFRTLRNDNESLSENICSDRPSAQVVFCIDVRSEVLRRKLNQICSTIQTYGFAGFFGLPIKLEDHNQNKAQCPVLISPSVTVIGKKSNPSKLMGVIKDSISRFSQLGFGSFTYVELFGLGSFVSILKDFFNSRSRKQISIHENKYNLIAQLETKVQIAQGILKNLSLTSPLSRIVLFCGHQSTVTNNPTEAALQCGACAGHSGAPNAIVAADLLNDTDIRVRLKELEYDIPSDTYFIAGIHDTVTDTVEILSKDIPSSHTNDLNELITNLNIASKQTASERNKLFWSNEIINSDISQLNKKMWDYSEVRPEWALAGNACFIVAPTNEIRNLNFNGRSFIHNYDQNLDLDETVLETILTAPMVVASWINLQYYASSIDPKNYGSGLKTIHNVCGNIGVVCGNDGDLAVGLSAQSVHDGSKLVHTPIRLNVVVRAQLDKIETILQRHPNVLSLILNGWVNLFAAPNDFNSIYKMSRSAKWQLQS